MSLQYAQKRIQEALKMANGNQTRARQQIIQWAAQDAKLLQGLTQHHLTGIVSYHIERVASGRATPAAPKSTPPAAAKTTIKKEDAFGMEILKAVANSSSAIFGLEGGAVLQKRPKTSQQHIDAMNAIAGRTKPLD